MKIQGAKGFAAIKYDVTQMGNYILENLAGIDKLQKMSKGEKAAFVKENYPKVMAFFKVHDLQPTLMNLRMNLQAIKSFDLSAHAAQPGASSSSSFSGSEKKVISSDEAMTVCCLLAFLVCIFFIID